MTSSVTPALATQVRARAVGRCEYCHAPQILIGQAFHIDHIVPRSVGGQTASANLCLACSHCNIAKGNQTHARDSRTGRVVSLFNPRAEFLGNALSLEFRLDKTDWSECCRTSHGGGFEYERIHSQACQTLLARCGFHSLADFSSCSWR